jgi:hypothetical protein
VTRSLRRVAALLLVLGGFDLAIGAALTAAVWQLADGPGALVAPGIPADLRLAVRLFAPALAAAGALKIAAGVRTRTYRSPALGRAALVSCAVSAANLACAPFALALLFWGLAVYRRPAASRAFLMRRQGLSPEWIEAALDRAGRET